MLLVPVEEGRRREGEERAAVAVNFLEVGGGRYSQPQVLLVLRAAVAPGRCRLSGSESPQPDSTVGEGRSRSRRKLHGEGAGKGRERGAAAKGGEGGS